MTDKLTSKGIKLTQYQGAKIAEILYSMNEKWDFRPSEVREALAASQLKEQIK